MNTTTTELPVDELTLEDHLALIEAAMAEVDLSGIDRAPYFKDQKLSTSSPRANLAPRKFSWTGTGADRVCQLVILGGWTRAEIALLAGVSVSRVAEVVWGLDARGVEYPEIVRNRKAVKAA